MHKWTDDANRELENYLDRVARLAGDRGDDPSEIQEIVEGLRDHVTQEAETNGETLITAERVRAILARLGTAEEVVGVEPDKPSVAPRVVPPIPPLPIPPHYALPKRAGSVFFKVFAIFTIIDAFAAILIAAGFIMADDAFVMPAYYGNDLMPIPLHLLGLLVVPLAIIYNLATLRCQWVTSSKDGKPALKQVDRPWRIRLGLMLNGYVLVVSAYYMLVFIPLLPIAVIGVLVLLGLLPLAPYFTFIVGLTQMPDLVRRARKMLVNPHWAWLGVVVGFTIYGGWAIHHFACKNAIELAFSTDADERAEGIRKLKVLHGEKKVLTACYRSFPQIFMDTRRTKPFYSRKEFQTLYYRMTGLDYRHVLRSEVVRDRGAKSMRTDWETDWEIDSEVGGSAVGTRVEGLSLYSSTIDAVVAGDREQKNAGPCVAYVQWVLEFKNDSNRQREARCQIQMPPGSVGSRLTLWIDDVEQEAAFGTRATVKKAYKEVAVRQRRDPALLTTDGPGRLLLQCFPIEPKSTMKVKVGMSVPMTIREMKKLGFQKQSTKAILRLPYFIDRNFMIVKDFAHDVWVESAVPMQSPDLEVEQIKEDNFTIRGEMTEADLHDSTKAIITLDPPKQSETLYTAELNGFSASDLLIENRPFEIEKDKPTRTVAIVVDTSRNCRRLKNFDFTKQDSNFDWDAFFKAVPKGVKFSLFVGKNSKENGEDGNKNGEDAYKKLSADQASKAMRKLLEEAKFDAADEQTGNLQRAWDLCAKSKHGLVLWVHGPMPYELSSCSGLVQRMTRRPGTLGGNAPRIASLQISPGPNLIENGLGSVTGMFRVPVFGSMKETLENIAKNLDRPGLVSSRLEFDFDAKTLEEKNREKTKPAEGVAQSPLPSQKSSDQIVRIALGQRVYGKCQARLKKEQQASLAKEAAQLRLVTPLTGAVVLETKAQYDAHDLDPAADLDATADIPEPETWVLLIAVFVAFVLMVWRQRRRERIPSPYH